MALVSGTIGAQFITVALSPVVTRLYGPTNFGAYGSLMSVVAVVSILAAAAYPVAVVVAEDEAEALGLTAVTALIAGVVSVVAFVVIVVLGRSGVNLAGGSLKGWLVLALPVLVLGTVAVQLVQYWLIRLEAFRASARIMVLQSATSSAGQVSLGATIPSLPSLVGATLFGQFAYIVLGARSVRSGVQGNARGAGIPLRSVARKYRDFPLLRAPQQFLNSVAENAPVVILGALFGLPAAGFYALSRRVLALPASLVGRSVGDVFYPRFVRAVDQGEPLTPLLGRVSLYLAVLGLLPFGLVVVAAPDLFAIAFGDPWRTAGDYARWLAIWLYFAFVNRAAVQALPVLNRQGVFLAFELVSTSFRLGALWLGNEFGSSSVAAVAIFSLAGAVSNVVLTALTLILCWKSSGRTGKSRHELRRPQSSKEE